MQVSSSGITRIADVQRRLQGRLANLTEMRRSRLLPVSTVRRMAEEMYGLIDGLVEILDEEEKQ